MNIYAIGDLHLSLYKPKEMDIFGSHWKDHFERIKADWESRVCEGDVVLIPGDISWAMKLSEAQPDLDAIGALPGTKIMIRGNHDYWWGSVAKVEACLTGDTRIIQNNCTTAGGYVFCGTRGWILPQDSDFSEEDRKIYDREKIRLELSLKSAQKHRDKALIVMMHYPPVLQNCPDTEFSGMLSAYGAREVVFGHIHGDVLNQIDLVDYKVGDVNYNLVSADYLDFRLKRII